MEQWNYKQRQDLLATNLANQKTKLFAAVKEEQKPALSHLQESFTVDVIGVSEDGTKLHLTESLKLEEPYEIRSASMPITVKDIQEDVIEIDEDLLIPKDSNSP